MKLFRCNKLMHLYIFINIKLVEFWTNLKGMINLIIHFYFNNISMFIALKNIYNSFPNVFWRCFWNLDLQVTIYFSLKHFFSENWKYGLRIHLNICLKDLKFICAFNHKKKCVFPLLAWSNAGIKGDFTYTLRQTWR